MVAAARDRSGAALGVGEPVAAVGAHEIVGGALLPERVRVAVRALGVVEAVVEVVVGRGEVPHSGFHGFGASSHYAAEQLLPPAHAARIPHGGRRFTVIVCASSSTSTGKGHVASFG